jgi:hypothetical protein
VGQQQLEERVQLRQLAPDGDQDGLQEKWKVARDFSIGFFLFVKD